jgi:hypothetical protein
LGRWAGDREENGMSHILEEAFRRYDETPDEKFYSLPRLVTHINTPNYKTS